MVSFSFEGVDSVYYAHAIQILMEIWKDIEGFRPYRVSDRGRVQGWEQGFLSLNPHITGYVIVSLRRGGKSHAKQVHRLVAEAFLPNPQDLAIVDHKNRNRVDNRVGNLRWVSVAENAANRSSNAKGNGRAVVQLTKTGKYVATWNSMQDAYRGTGIGIQGISNQCRGISAGTGAPFRWKYVDALSETADSKTEEWKTVIVEGGHEFEVSSLGRVQSTNRGATYGSDDGAGYKRTGNRTRGHHAVHRLVALAFHGPPPSEGFVVNHIDRDKSNNTPSNLEWVSQQQNVLHSYAQGRRSPGSEHRNQAVQWQPVDEKAAAVTYRSISEASRVTGLTRSLVSNACGDPNKVLGGGYWHRVRTPNRNPATTEQAATINDVIEFLDTMHEEWCVREEGSNPEMIALLDLLLS